jgi:hypothetical protein
VETRKALLKEDRMIENYRWIKMIKLMMKLTKKKKIRKFLKSKWGFNFEELLEDDSKLEQLMEDEKSNLAHFKGDKNNNATKALVEALNHKYEKDTKNLKRKAWDLAFIKKDTLAFRSLLKNALDKYNKDWNIQSAADAFAAVSWYKRCWGHLRAGKISFAWRLTIFIIVVLVTIVVIAAPLIQGLWVFVAPFIGVFSVVWSRIVDGIKRVTTLTEAIDDARELEGDIETGKGDEMTKLKHDIDVLEKRLWVKKGESLDDVVRDRLDSGGYAEQLGVVHKAQEDLQRLSDALLNKSDHAKKIFPRGDPRIILFIDDLDRCPPDKVVEMLEALQLLVKTELFVVVVALDMRYVTLALEDHYKGILEAGRTPSGLDYLENMIQLPYRLPPVNKHEAMHQYVGAQLGKLKEDDVPASDPGGQAVDLAVTHNGDNADPASELDEVPDANSGGQAVDRAATHGKENADPARELEKVSETERAPESLSVEPQSLAPQPGSGSELPPSPPPFEPQSLIRMVPIQVSGEEHNMLTEACLAASVNPRSIRRLANVFKTMKVIWRNNETEPHDELKRACVFLLAMCASKSNTLLRGMRATFNKMEESMEMPKQHSNLREFVENVAGAAVPESGLVNNVLEKVTWEDDAEWKNVKAHLRLVSCFSIIGPYTESDRVHIEAEQKKKQESEHNISYCSQIM